MTVCGPLVGNQANVTYKCCCSHHCLPSTVLFLREEGNLTSPEKRPVARALHDATLFWVILREGGRKADPRAVVQQWLFQFLDAGVGWRVPGGGGAIVLLWSGQAAITSFPVRRKF
jgi:hypothetical protein